VNNQLKIFRKKKQLTQQQMADVLGVSRQTIISIEQGKYDPSLPLAFKIAHYFDAKIEDIFSP
jgi:putative transcriptional regulator